MVQFRTVPFSSHPSQYVNRATTSRLKTRGTGETWARYPFPGNPSGASQHTTGATPGTGIVLIEHLFPRIFEKGTNPDKLHGTDTARYGMPFPTEIRRVQASTREEQLLARAAR